MPPPPSDHFVLACLVGDSPSPRPLTPSGLRPPCPLFILSPSSNEHPLLQPRSFCCPHTGGACCPSSRVPTRWGCLSRLLLGRLGSLSPCRNLLGARARSELWLPLYAPGKCPCLPVHLQWRGDLLQPTLLWRGRGEVSLRPPLLSKGGGDWPALSPSHAALSACGVQPA